MDGKPLNNLFIVGTKITNTGKVPILPSDFIEALSLNSEEPWSLLAVENEHFAVPFQWKKVNNFRFDAKPTLLNPGDTVMVKVYLTNSKLVDKQLPT